MWTFGDLSSDTAYWLSSKAAAVLPLSRISSAALASASFLASALQHHFFDSVIIFAFRTWPHLLVGVCCRPLACITHLVWRADLYVVRAGDDSGTAVFKVHACMVTIEKKLWRHDKIGFTLGVERHPDEQQMRYFCLPTRYAPMCLRIMWSTCSAEV